MSSISAIAQQLSKSPRPSAKSMRILCEHLVPPRKLLGIDFGTRFLGLAISDGSNLIARPLAVFDERSASRVFGLGSDSLSAIIQDNEIDALVVGLPFTSGDGEDEACERVRRFVRDLHSHRVTNRPAFLWDEKGTSQHVREILKETRGVGVGANFHSNRAVLLANKKRGSDKIAACVILQRFLDHFNHVRTSMANHALSQSTSRMQSTSNNSSASGPDPFAMHMALMMQMQAARGRSYQKNAPPLSALLPRNDPYVILPSSSGATHPGRSSSSPSGVKS